MTPQKKTAVPKLSDLVKDKEVENPSVVDEDVTPQAVDVEKPPASTEDVAKTPDLNFGFDSDVKSDEDSVHKWEENHDHNLAKVHPDVLLATPPSEQAAVTSVVTDTVYADVAELDDKGRNGNYDDEDVPPNAGSVE